jgi:hypothetical protein
VVEGRQADDPIGGGHGPGPEGIHQNGRDAGGLAKGIAELQGIHPDPRGAEAEEIATTGWNIEQSLANSQRIIPE